MTRIMNWNGYLDFLVIARAGSISAAARELGLSQPTLSRRLSLLEQQLGVTLLIRTPSGLRTTAAGDRLLNTLESVRDRLEQMEAEIGEGDVALRGSVRITVTETLGITWLAPLITEFNELYPHIRIELVIENTMLNLLSREAHIAIRLLRPYQADLIAKHVGTFDIALYAARSYAARYGLPERPEDASKFRAVGLLGSTPTATLTDKIFTTDRHVLLSNSLMAAYYAIRNGLGIGPVLDLVGDADPTLVRCLPDVRLRKEIWLTAVPELRQSARLRAVYNFLGDHLAGGIRAMAFTA